MRHITSRTLLPALLCSLLVLVLSSCARQGYPEGGPRDVQPPRIVGETPANNSLHFQSKSFFVEFDEYVVITDADNNVIVSPPMQPKPTYATRRHGIQVTLNDTLRDSTTYLFQFKEAVADLTEGNKLTSYEYAFSTGNTIDSMMLRGMVLEAFTHRPCTNTVTVMLYPADAPDSAVALQSPSNITRCDKEGHFAFSHIKPGHYHIYAIEDADKDLRLGANEAVAFIDSTVIAAMPSDSIAPHYQMLMSFEERKVQRVTESKMLQEGYAEIVTMLPLSAPTVQADTAIIWRLNPTADTLRLWTLNPQCTSMVLLLSDSSGLSDTIKLQYRRKKKGQTTPSSSKWLNWQVSSAHPIFLPLGITTTIPIDSSASILDSAVRVMQLPDSTISYCSLKIDSTLLSAQMIFTPAVDKKYEFTLLHHHIVNIYGAKADSNKVSTEIQSVEKYGNIIITLVIDDSISSPYVVQLTDGDGKVLQEQSLDGTTRATFQRLKPGNYGIQAYADRNGDKKWTAANYWLHRQPEPSYYLNKTLNLRANWDIEEKLNVGSNIPIQQPTFESAETKSQNTQSRSKNL